MFDWEAIESLEVKTLEAIEEITGPLTHNEELKAEDASGDLVTIVKTTTTEGQDVIQYVRRSHANDTDEGVVTFTITL